MKVFCIGEALIDMICSDKGLALSAGEHFLKKAGGAPANVAAAIAALGGTVDMAAKVGKDPFGKHLIELLNKMNVSTKWIIQDPAHFTTLAFVSLMDNGERDFYFNRGADGHLSIADLATLQMNDYGIIHFGSATAFLPGSLQATYSTILEQAKKAGAIISFDPNYRQLLYQDNKEAFIAQCWPFIEQAHFFKMSDEEALLITACSTLENATQFLRSKTNAVFAISLGKEGTLLCLGNTTAVIPSILVQPVDTTGAGDAFVGAVLFQLINKTLQQLKDMNFSEWKIRQYSNLITL